MKYKNSTVFELILILMLSLFVCTGVLPACIYVHHVCAVAVGARRVHQVVMDVCELLCGHWELNLCPMQDQQVLSSTVSFLQTQTNIFSCKQPRIGGFYFYPTQKSNHWKLYVLISEMPSTLIN